MSPPFDAAPPRRSSSLNVLGEPLQSCSTQPMTGFFRDGCCETGADDFGRHVVCSVMSEAFLQFSRARGNDLITPRPEYDFPGLRAGDRWCLCALRWREAAEAGCAPAVVLEATHQRALELIELTQLRRHALSPDTPQ